MVHSTLVGNCSTVFWTHLSACHLYSWLLHSGFHCGIHSTAVPGFVDSIVMNFSLWGSSHSCLPACLPALGFVCCSARSTAVCRKVHSAYWSHAVTPLFAPQLSAILYSCPLWDPQLYHLPSIATALKLLRRIDLISCRLRTVRNHTLKSTSKT